MSMCKVKIARYEVGDVVAGSKIKYNVGNIWNKDGRPADYDLKSAKNLTDKWISLFHDKVHIITLDKEDLLWIKEAFDIGGISGRFPRSYQEELDEACQKNHYRFPTNNKYFVRTDYVSLKHGIHGTGPYTNIKSVIESIVTSKHNHSCFRPEDTICNIYLMPWIENYKEEKEFRVFVCCNKVVAVSIQNIYQVNNWLDSLSDKISPYLLKVY